MKFRIVCFDSAKAPGECTLPLAAADSIEIAAAVAWALAQPYRGTDLAMWVELKVKNGFNNVAGVSCNCLGTGGYLPNGALSFQTECEARVAKLQASAAKERQRVKWVKAHGGYTGSNYEAMRADEVARAAYFANDFGTLERRLAQLQEAVPA